MQLMKNGVRVSFSRAFGNEDNLFGTAILNLVVGDEVSPFNCMMQIKYTYVVQGVPAFRDFTIRDPRYFVIHFQAQFREFLSIS